MTAPDVFPCPVFEGSEKRISVHFAAAAAVGGGTAAAPPAGGLRTLSRPQLDAMLDLAACQIVSARSNEAFDAYVLSESSLFVYPDRMVLKTCGTTKLLDCVPYMLELAAGIGLAPARVHYSRASFLFPHQQPAPHTSFEQECGALRSAFTGLPSSSAYVLGDALNGLQWHVFVAGVENAHTALRRERPLHTLEVCMTGLSPAKAAQFFRGQDFVSSRAVTVGSGIQALVPGASIDDYVFEPCGYSMNGIKGEAFSTMHITPEDGFSYASFEICGHCPDSTSTAELVAKTAAIFEPSSLSVALSLDSVAPGASTPGWGGAFLGPPGYDIHSASYQELKCGGYVAYFTLERQPQLLPALAAAPAGAATAAPVPVPAGMAPVGTKVAAGAGAGDDSANGSDGGSPRGVLKHFPSSCTLAGSASTGMHAHGRDSSSGGSRSGATSEGEEGSASEGEREESENERFQGSSHALTASMMSVMTELDLLALQQGGGSASEEAGGSSSFDSASDNASVLNSLMVDPSDMRFEDVLALHGAAHLPTGDSAAIETHMRGLISTHALEDNFYVVDLGALQRLHSAWCAALPRVTPFYAVKCNPDAGILAALASLGACFDCASEAEIAAVLGLGVSPERIIFANPCKRPRDVRYAGSKGVCLSTFDTEAELCKLARWQPGAARVLLRIRADDPTARCQLGNKYGAKPAEWEGLFRAARQLGVSVEGIAFHVGSGATDPAAFAYAIQLARAAFDLGRAHGFDMKLLDIGGGFCGGRFGPDGRVDMGGVPAAVNAALALHFPDASGVRVIAEPGRFFAESIATMGCMVFGRRVCALTAVAAMAAAECASTGMAQPLGQPLGQPAPALPAGFDYWVTDGIYGSMNSMLYDHATLSTRPLMVAGGPPAPVGSVPTLPSTVFGPSCDGLDTLLTDTPLPELQVGDWLAFPAMGAYTICGASKFNGINAVDVPTFYVCSAQP